jgi:hypothetical protein
VRFAPRLVDEERDGICNEQKQGIQRISVHNANTTVSIQESFSNRNVSHYQ